VAAVKRFEHAAAAPPIAGASAHAKALTWVHLSDLHFGHGADAACRFDQKLVMRAICRDLSDVREQLGSPDYVFLTGDIAFSANAKAEYLPASDWLAQVLTVLGVPPERALPVPGNHDVDRRLARAGTGAVLHAGLRAQPKLLDNLHESAEMMQAIWPKLAAYQEFAKGYGAPEIHPGRPFWTKALEHPLGPIVAIGLNTSLLSFDDGDSGETLALGLGQLQNAIDAQAPGTLLVVLQHHPPEWLRDGSMQRSMLERSPHLLLCGHIHSAEGFLRQPLTRQGTLELVAGAGHGDVGQAGEHAYAWGRLSAGGLEYFPRVWSPQNQCFLAQRIAPRVEFRQQNAQGDFIHASAERLPRALREWVEARAPATKAPPSSGVATRPSVGSTMLESAVAPKAAPYDPRRSHFFVPHRAKGDGVVGREKLLTRVRGQLERGRRTAIGQTASFVGLGGLGKTQMAVEYAHEYRSAYPGGVYWFTADEDLDAQLTCLARDARWVNPDSELEVQVEIATNQIRTRSDCLIIFDNVESIEAIAPLLPGHDANPHLLLTSREPQRGFDTVPLEQLDPSQSLEMLALESRRDLSEKEHRDAALRIARELDGLPLALELVGAYLRRYPTARLKDCADQLEARGIEIQALRSKLGAESHTKHETGLRAALRLNDALFDETALLRELLDLLAWSGPASMGHKLLAAVLPMADVGDLTHALNVATSVGVLKEEQGPQLDGGPRFLMHRLVREVRRLDVPLERHAEPWATVLRFLGDWFQTHRNDFRDLPVFEAEVDHLEAWRANAVHVGNEREASRLEWLQAYPADRRGRYQNSHQLVQRALERFERATISDPELEARLRSDLGYTLCKLGRLEEALQQERRALELREQHLGRRHPDTALSLGNLGGTLGALGNHARALEYERQALDIRREVLGDRHPDTAAALNNLGATLGALGDHRQALDHYREALDINREVLGERHPDTASSLNNLGGMLCALGDRAQGLGYFRRAFTILSEVLGEHHPTTGSSLNNIGSNLSMLGQHDEALDCGRRALAIKEKALGGAHPEAIHVRLSYAIALANAGQKHPALEVLQRGLKLAPGHAGLKRLQSQLLRKKTAVAKKKKR
jgi:tetratricopeptide (TPR) repeat protein